EANPIDQSEKRAKAFDPPCVTGPVEDIPTIKRVSPQLPGRAEVIGWHAGDNGWAAVRVEPEQLASSPDIGPVRADEDRRAPPGHDAWSAAGIAKALPLFEEEKLGQ